MRYLYVLIFSLITLNGFAQKLRIAVAANAQFVAQHLAEELKKETGIDADLIVGSSGKLTAQIEQGAPFDVFLSADMKYPQELYTKQLTTAKPQVYAYGKLVIWTTKGVDISKGLSALTQPEVQKIAVGNPKTAPYGEAALQAINRLNLLPQLKSKIVYGESLAQVNQYLLSGNADVALTAESVVTDPSQKGKGKWAPVDKSLYQPIAQGIVILKQSTGKNLTDAQKFYKFIFSTKAKAIFTAYGYSL